MASNMGNIKRLVREVVYPKGGVRVFPEVILDNKPLPTGYIQVCISIDKIRKHHMVHRLVVETFLENVDDKPCVNHKNSIRHDNRLSNLEWCTSAENNQHAFDFGFGNAKSGEDNHLSKITENQVKKIYTLSKKGDILQKDISLMFGISRQNVSSIKLKKAWKKVTDKLDKENL